ncbi:RadC family protein [Xanthomonas citri pv. malvacearum str. GSPB2388]|uniref:hypothetical protein n=1 Tax=Xanthomonas citri TaxID=346 RepID=UPI00029750CF|nr:RadC family protein [Xanthomonas citri pv. malvacearum str. GSPB2388]
MKRSTQDLLMDEADILMAVEEILQRHLERQGTIGSSTEAKDYLAARCAHLPHEVFGCMWLDNRPA